MGCHFFRRGKHGAFAKKILKIRFTQGIYLQPWEYFEIEVALTEPGNWHNKGEIHLLPTFTKKITLFRPLFCQNQMMIWGQM